MTQTLVAVFDSYAEAESAFQQLQAIGLAEGSMQVHADTVATYSTAETAVTATEPAGQPTGTLDKIEHFFTNLFGNDNQPTEAGHYKEAVRRGGALLTINDVPEEQVDEVEDVLEQGGAVDIDSRASAWQAEGAAGDGVTSDVAPHHAVSATANVASESGQTLEAVEETIAVGKQVANKGHVRVYTRPTETAFNETVQLRDEQVVVDRKAVNRPATATDFQPESIELTETTERPVVSKTAHVVEEVSVGKVVTERTETVTDTLRGTKIEIERDGKVDPS